MELQLLQLPLSVNLHLLQLGQLPPVLWKFVPFFTLSLSLLKFKFLPDDPDELECSSLDSDAF